MKEPNKVPALWGPSTNWKSAPSKANVEQQEKGQDRESLSVKVMLETLRRV